MDMPEKQFAFIALEKVRAFCAAKRSPRAFEQLAVDVLAVAVGLKPAAMIDYSTTWKLSDVEALLSSLPASALCCRQLGDCVWLLHGGATRSPPRFIQLDGDEPCWASSGVAATALANCGVCWCCCIVLIADGRTQRKVAPRSSPVSASNRRPRSTAFCWATRACFSSRTELPPRARSRRHRCSSSNFLPCVERWT